MKTNLFSLAFVLLIAACAALSAKPSAPCAGMYCIEASLVGVPGAAVLCYKTADELAAAKAYWRGKGYTVTDKKVQEK